MVCKDLVKNKSWQFCFQKKLVKVIHAATSKRLIKQLRTNCTCLNLSFYSALSIICQVINFRRLRFNARCPLVGDLEPRLFKNKFSRILNVSRKFFAPWQVIEGIKADLPSLPMQTIRQVADTDFISQTGGLQPHHILVPLMGVRE